MAFLPGTCSQECGRIRTLLLGWERQYPAVVSVLVSDVEDPWVPPIPSKGLRGGSFVTRRAVVDGWTDALTAPRLFVLDADGVISLRRDGFAAGDARDVADTLRRVVGQRR